MGASVVELLCRLIGRPSVNPRLALPGDPPEGEQPLTELLIDCCRDAGWPWARQEVHPGRSNLLALVEGGRGDVLLWDAHQDTVSGSGMCVEPFAAKVVGGRVFGRGACDVKGAMAAMLAALARASAQPPGGRPTVLLAFTVNEECGFSGARALAGLCSAPGADLATVARDSAARVNSTGGLTWQKLAACRPRAALVAEPTELNTVVAHRGVVRWQCRATGRAAHSSRPEEGVNAVYALAEAVRLVQDYHQHELGRRAVDTLCGPSTAVVTTFHGGTGPNTIPDTAIIDVDRRLTPDESPAEAYQDLVAYLAARANPNAAKLWHDPPWMESRGLAAGDNAAWADEVSAAARLAGGAPRILGVPYGTNAASIAAAGIPAVVFGPGSIAQAHTVDEWIAIDQLERAEDAFYRLACGTVSA